MIRYFDGESYETKETMIECALHGGSWDQANRLCVLEDSSAFASYLGCVRVDDQEPMQEGEVDVAHTEQYQGQVAEANRINAEMNRRIAEEFAAEIERGKLTYTGLSPDAPVVQNGRGGLQSVVEGRFDLLPPVAMFELAKVMEHGAKKYAPRNWMKIPVDSHLNHLLMHVFAYLAGDRQEEHLTHALARAAMAVEIERLGVQE